MLALVPAIGLTQPDSGESLRAEFAAAYERARTGTAAAEAYSTALHDYLLFPYLEAALLGSDLEASGDDWSAADVAMLAFLNEHGDQPVTVNARLLWLRSLADRELWQEFLTHYRDGVADTALRCRRFSVGIALGDDTPLAAQISEIWLTPRQLPLDCEPLFQWARDAGWLDDELTEARVRLLLESGDTAFARVIARRLPDDRQRPLLAWARLIEEPAIALQAYLDELGAGIDTAGIEPQMLLDAWTRLSRDRPDEALTLYDSLLEFGRLDSRSASPYSLALALGLAWDRRPEALGLFARVAEADLDDYALAWRARAALWHDDWDLVRDSIAAMSPAQRESSEWLFWAARSNPEDGERELLYRSILPRDNYFSAMAAAELRNRASTHPETHPRDDQVVAELIASPAVRRAAELRQVGLPVAASREWQFAQRSWDASQRAQSIHLAMDIGWYDLGVATASEHGIFFDYELLYPRPYLDAVRAAADEFELDPALILAVIRQESLYRADAVSSADARGLMQIRTGTAREIAGSLEDSGPDPIDLLDPATNIRLGTARLRRMLERYDGHLLLALAAYNAGPAAADRWIPERTMASDVWLANVPYNETREYVRRVLWHWVVFESLDNRRINPRSWPDEVGPL